ncbi:hypothetical protein C8F01DRAFT_1264041 [Mycena amicta]|nr:hypothetical protein C8F01DRAFT_1264041 [Mycena amicta]
MENRHLPPVVDAYENEPLFFPSSSDGSVLGDPLSLSSVLPSSDASIVDAEAETVPFARKHVPKKHRQGCMNVADLLDLEALDADSDGLSEDSMDEEDVLFIDDEPSHEYSPRMDHLATPLAEVDLVAEGDELKKIALRFELQARAQREIAVRNRPSTAYSPADKHDSTPIYHIPPETAPPMFAICVPVDREFTLVDYLVALGFVISAGTC